MTYQFTVVAIVLIVVIAGGLAFAMADKEAIKEPIQPNTDIRLNSLGYLPAAQKKATIITECSNFTVKDASKNKTVYSGKVTGPFPQKDVNQTAWFADFSKLNKPGKYYLEVPGLGRSIDFEIGDKVYDFAFYTSMRAFYLWRCGTEVNAIFNGNHYYHAACHTDDAGLDYIADLDPQYLNSLPPSSQDTNTLNAPSSQAPSSQASSSQAISPQDTNTLNAPGSQAPSPQASSSQAISPRDPNAHGPNSHRDATGGWHDAGDYNKYVVNAGVTVGAMFLAWEQFER